MPSRARRPRPRTRTRRGHGGHGYDPVFLDPARGRTAAEMPLDEKNRISHRGRALAQLRTRLPDVLARLR